MDCGVILVCSCFFVRNDEEEMKKNLHQLLTLALCACAHGSWMGPLLRDSSSASSGIYRTGNEAYNKAADINPE